MTRIVGKKSFFSAADRKKACGKCGVVKKLTEFRRSSPRPGRIHPPSWESGHWISWCKDCENDRAKKYQAQRYVRRKA